MNIYLDENCGWAENEKGWADVTNELDEREGMDEGGTGFKPHFSNSTPVVIWN